MTPTAALIVLLSALLHPIRDLLLKGHRHPESAYLAVTGGWVTIAAVHALASGTSLRLPEEVWGLALASAFCLTAYYFGTMAALKTGDLSIYYPIIRSSPLLIVALTWAYSGQTYAPVVLVGILVIVIAGFALQRQPGRLLANPRIVALAMVAMAGSAGYTIADAQAMTRIEPPAFLFWVYVLVTPAFAALARIFKPPEVSTATLLMAGWRHLPLRLATASLVSYISYLLILIAFQIGAGAAETAAVRQASIPVSVVLAALVLGETRFLSRLGWATLMAIGIVLILLNR